MNKWFRVALAALSAASVAGSSLAQPGAAAAVQARQGNLKQLGAAFKAINDELKKDTPDPALLKASSAKMSALATQLPTWFPKGSGVESGVKTEARPEIWSDPQGFAEAARALQGQTAKLAQLGAGSDLAAFKAQVRPTGGACKGCHDKYRLEEKK